MADRFDVVVIGAGPAGEHALDVLLDAGKKVALVASIGGECSGWACMPTKTLVRPTEVQGEADRVAGVSQPSFDWPKIRDYRRSPRTTRGVSSGQSYAPATASEAVAVNRRSIVRFIGKCLQTGLF
jgi:pyruvate/2-oxoglutarate dehydrogenase complex dihydrolipoamide dehydrogenase (E3) component